MHVIYRYLKLYFKLVNISIIKMYFDFHYKKKRFIELILKLKANTILIKKIVRKLKNFVWISS